MNHWIVPLLVAVCGALGGLAKTLMNGAGDLKLVSVARDGDGSTLVRGGFLVNCVIGAIAALASWMLYGSSAAVSIFTELHFDLTLANCGAAVLVGLAGSGWLSAELDKNVLRKVAVGAANTEKDSDLAGTIATASPDQALKAVLEAREEPTAVPPRVVNPPVEPPTTKTAPTEAPVADTPTVGTPPPLAPSGTTPATEREPPPR